VRDIIFLGCIVLLAKPTLAETLSDATRLISEVSTLLASQTSDKKIARHVEQAKLTNSLTDDLVENLSRRYTIGPYTTFALNIQTDKSLYLTPPGDKAVNDTAPSAQEVIQLDSTLQNYIGKSIATWRKFVANTTITTSFSNQKNDRSAPEKRWYARQQNQFYIDQGSDSVNTPIGHLLYLQHATLQWRRWDLCGKKKVAVFEFFESPHSAFQQTKRRANLIVGLNRGLVSFFPEDGTVCRLIMISTGKHSHLRYMGTIATTVTTAFQKVSIDGISYWFPNKIVIMTNSTSNNMWLRRVITGAQYQKLDAKTTVAY
jgi:hypothetical protein